MATGTTDNSAPAASSSTPAPSSSASTPASSGSPAPGGSSTPSGPSTTSGSGSSETALGALEKASKALEAASSPASPQPAGSGSPVPPNPAATSAAAAPGSPQATPPSAEAPESRIQRAVGNVRKEYEDFLQPLGGREKITRSVGLVQRLDSDSVGFASQLAAELGYELVPRGSAQTQPEAPPLDMEPDLVDQSGKLKAFSSEKMLAILRHEVSQAVQAVREELSPVVEDHYHTVEQRQAAAIDREGETNATEAMRDMKTRAHFTGNEKAIGDYYSRIPQAWRQRFGPVAALERAYNQFMAEVILPTLGQREKEKTLADMQRSAFAGSTAVSAAPVLPAKKAIREGNLDDLANRMKEIAGAQAAS